MHQAGLALRPSAPSRATTSASRMTYFSTYKARLPSSTRHLMLDYCSPKNIRNNRMHGQQALVAS